MLSRGKSGCGDFDQWVLASEAFLHGRPNAARRHLAAFGRPSKKASLTASLTNTQPDQRARRHDVLPVPPSISSCLELNKSAIDVALVCASSKHDAVEGGKMQMRETAVASANVASHAESVAVKARSAVALRALTATDTASAATDALQHRTVQDLAETAFAGEMAASASYNSSLAALYAQTPLPGFGHETNYLASVITHAERGVSSVVRTAICLVKLSRLAWQRAARSTIREPRGSLPPDWSAPKRRRQNESASEALHCSASEADSFCRLDWQSGGKEPRGGNWHRPDGFRQRSVWFQASSAVESLRLSFETGETTASELYRKDRLCDTVRKQSSRQFRSDSTASAVQRWAEAAGALLELTGAILLTAGKISESRDAVATSKAFLDFAASLVTPGTGVIPVASVTLEASKSRNGFAVPRDAPPDSSIEDPAPDDNDSSVESEVRSTLERNSLPTLESFSSGCGYAYFDRSGSRGACLCAIGFALSAEWDSGLDCVRESVRNLVSNPTALNRPFMPGPDHHWPSVYAASAIMLLRGDRKDHGNVLALLDACASAGYRPADATALGARISTGDLASSRWERVMSMDHARSGGLWTAARSFALAGRHEARASLLECLEDLLHCSSRYQDSGRLTSSSAVGSCRSVGFVSLRPGRIEYQSQPDWYSILPGRREYQSGCATDQDSCAPGTALPISPSRVRIERARALAASGRYTDALDVIREYAVGCGGVHVLSGLDDEGVLRDYCWTLTCAQELDEAVAAADSAFARASTGYAGCAALLAKADALVNSEKIDSALNALGAAFQKADLTRVLSACRGSDRDSRSIWDEDAVQFLRGVCYNNMGVLNACKQDLTRADSFFMAAQVSFGKCVESGPTSPWRHELLRYAKLNRDAATFNRSLVLWRRGAAEDAISMWTAYVGDCADTMPVGLSIADDVNDAGEEALREAEAEESRAIEGTPPEMRVGGAHVLGQLSDGQRASMTLVCIARRQKTKIETYLRGGLEKLQRKAVASTPDG